MGDYIYHLVQEAKWKEASGEGYLPPTYAADGFIHATKEGHLLLPVANHFYTGSLFLHCRAQFTFTRRWVLSSYTCATYETAALPCAVFPTLWLLLSFLCCPSK